MKNRKHHPAIKRMRPHPVWNTRSKSQLARLKYRLSAIGKPSMCRRLQTGIEDCMMNNFLGRMYHNHIGRGIIHYVRNWGWCQSWYCGNSRALYSGYNTYIPTLHIAFKPRWHNRMK